MFVILWFLNAIPSFETCEARFLPSKFGTTSQRKFTVLCGTFALLVFRHYSRVKIFVISMTKYAVANVAQFPCIHRRFSSKSIHRQKVNFPASVVLISFYNSRFISLKNYIRNRINRRHSRVVFGDYILSEDIKLYVHILSLTDTRDRSTKPVLCFSFI